MAHSDSTHGHTIPTGGVEEDHVNIRAIFSFGIGLALVTIVVHLLMLWMWHIEVANVDASNPPRVYPLAVQTQEERRPPVPRLQDGIETAGPKEALKELREEEEHVLDNYSWVDRNNEIVRIPVEDAMKLTLQRGLPSRPATAAADGQGAAAAPAATQEKK
jgi:hypothetical protein